jgi:hypothetical protein
MPRGKTPEEEALKYRIETRVNEAKWNELQGILKKTMNVDMSALLRDILHNRQIKLYTYDRTLDMVMEQLASIRAELKYIGVNINQITKRFHSYPDLKNKIFYGKIVFEQYVAQQEKVDRLLAMITELAKRWLQK